MTPENIASIKAANEAFAQADSELGRIETGTDDVMDKVSRIEALTDKVRDLSLRAGSLIGGSLSENIEHSDRYIKEALEDLRVVGINPDNQATGSVFVHFREAQEAKRRASLGSQKVAKELNTAPGMSLIKAQGVFVSQQGHLVEGHLKAARSEIKHVIKAGNALCEEDSL